MVCRTLTAFCVTVATSCELVAIVDRDGQGINSAGARTPHEPLSFVPMSATWLMGCVSFGCAGCLLPSYAPPMGKGWCGSCASGLLSCVSCCSSIEFVVAVVGASIYHVDVHIHSLVVWGRLSKKEVRFTKKEVRFTKKEVRFFGLTTFLVV